MSHNLFDTVSTHMRTRHNADFIVTPEGRNYNYAQALDMTATLAATLVALSPCRSTRARKRSCSTWPAFVWAACICP